MSQCPYAPPYALYFLIYAPNASPMPLYCAMPPPIPYDLFYAPYAPTLLLYPYVHLCPFYVPSYGPILIG